MAIEKSPHGAPCNSCGRCCAEEVCPLGQSLFGVSKGPCFALQAIDEHRFVCGVIADPATYAPFRVAQHGAHVMAAAAAQLLGAGRGCDANLDGERVNYAFLVQMLQPPTPDDVVAADLWELEICTD